MMPTSWDAAGNAKAFGQVDFGFWYPGAGAEEFASTSNAKLVLKKFHEFYQGLSGSHETKNLEKGALSIEVDGAIKARFFKTGRLFDVELKEK